MARPLGFRETGVISTKPKNPPQSMTIEQVRDLRAVLPTTIWRSGGTSPTSLPLCSLPVCAFRRPPQWSGAMLSWNIAPLLSGGTSCG